MKTKFTEGPWVVSGSYIKCEKGHIAQSKAIFLNNKQLIANAHLIAAAPDMYKEIEQDILWLQRLSEDYVIGSYELRSCILRIKTKKSLLAKARGESNE